MEELDRALADITAIRSQLARGTEFRGYGPMTVAATGFVAVAAAGIQALWLPDPAADLLGYVVHLGGNRRHLDRAHRHRDGGALAAHPFGLADAMIHAATEQFTPAGVAGALLTFVLFRFAPQSLWMLPGLWQIIFSLGIFASCRSLPRPMFAAGVWYLAAGLAGLAFANGAHAYSPWAMAVPFGIGQLLIAAVLYWCVGESDGEA